MFCRIDCKSVFEVLSLSTEMHFSIDLALMSNTKQHVDNTTQMITKVDHDIQTAARRNFET